MGQRLIRPGLLGAGLFDSRDPWWLVGGLPSLKLPHFAAEDSDDPNDDKYTGEGGEEEDEDESEEDDDDKPKGKKSSKKSTKDDDEDDEDEDEDDPRVARASRQAAKYRTKLREQEARNTELENRLKALENKDRKPEEIASEELTQVRSKVESLTTRNRQLVLENAFLASNQIDWVDPEDALRLVDLSDVDVDDDGSVDRRALRAALKDLARRKPHLVKKAAKASGPAGDDDEDDDEDQGSRRQSAAPMNGKRKGSRGNSNRAALEKDFPVLRTLRR